MCLYPYVYVYVSFTFLLQESLYLNFGKNYMSFKKRDPFEWSLGGSVALLAPFERNCS